MKRTKLFLRLSSRSSGLVAVILGMIVFLALPGFAVGQDWYDSDWGYREPITITGSSVLIGKAASTDSWTTKADMPTARYYLGCAVANNKIYAIGGIWGGTVGTSANEEYDPSTDDWTTKADMPITRGCLTCAVVNNKIYAIGGFAGSESFATNEEYDPAKDTWTTKADMPAARSGLACAAVNNKIYIIGGSSENVLVATNEEYDPAKDTWTTKADMPTARYYLTCAVVNNKIYAIGGYDRGGSFVATNEEYDPAKDTWTTKADMPTARFLGGCAVVNNKIYIIGGAVGSDFFATNEEYDPAKDTWTTRADMPAPRACISCVAVNNKIYVIGGSDGTIVATNEEYDPLGETGIEDIINVPGDQPTIQAGIGVATDGDTVLVDTGTYVENINFDGKNIVVGSLFITTGDTGYISRTVIDGNQNGSVVKFENGEDSTAVLCGFTITNGYAQGESSPDTRGGGILCHSNSSPSLTNLVVSGNKADWSGGGIDCSNSSPSLKNVTISGNTGTFNGGGIMCCDSSNMRLVNVTISGNTAGAGGGIYFAFGASMSLVNTIIWNDYSDPSYPQEIWLNSYGDPNSITIAYSDVDGGEAGIMTNDNGTVNWLDGNIDTDPLFVGGDPFDYHLTENSPCINAGTALFVWEGDTLVNMDSTEYIGCAPDMGAFESPFILEIDEDQIPLPNKFCLYQNYPNPFNPGTTIKFDLRLSTHVTLVIYNLIGQKVATLVDRNMEAGYGKELRFDASDIPSGIYFYRLTAGDFVTAKKMIVMK